MSAARAVVAGAITSGLRGDRRQRSICDAFAVASNLELVRSIYADWERADASSAAWADSNIEAVFADGPHPGRWVGLAGMAAGWRDVMGVWEDLHAKVEQYRELDGERVLALIRWRGRGKRSGADVWRTGAKGAQLFQVHNGKVVRYVVWFDRDRAFADLGLTPEAGSSGT